MVVVLSDNGASQEGGADGTLHEMKHFNGIRETPDEAVARDLNAVSLAETDPDGAVPDPETLDLGHDEGVPGFGPGPVEPRIGQNESGQR